MSEVNLIASGEDVKFWHSIEPSKQEQEKILNSVDRIEVSVAANYNSLKIAVPVDKTIGFWKTFKYVRSMLLEEFSRMEIVRRK